MGSPISPLIANMFMEEFEVKALQSFPNPPSLWLRFVDDTFVINKAEHSQDLLQHINNQDPHIQFTVEPTQQGSLPFLDTLVTIQPDNTFSTSVYRKPIHTDLYLQWDSNHHITAKVFSTPWHIGQKQFLQHRTIWTRNSYTLKQPSTTANSLPGHSTNGNTNSTIPTRPQPPPTTTQPATTTTRPPLLSPTSLNTADKFKKLCKRRGIQVHFKGTNTLRTALDNPMDKDPKPNQTGVIYQYQCPHINCSSSYIGESGRSLGERVKEHLKAPSPIHLHSTTTGHPLGPNQFNIVHKEVHSQSRTIKEAMFICIQDSPSTGI